MVNIGKRVRTSGFQSEGSTLLQDILRVALWTVLWFGGAVCTVAGVCLWVAVGRSTATLLDFYSEEDMVLMCGNIEWVDWTYLLNKGVAAALLLSGIGTMIWAGAFIWQKDAVTRAVAG